MDTKYHTQRRRLEEGINIACHRLSIAAAKRDPREVQSAAEELALLLDELVSLVGGHRLFVPADCPDCGQELT